MKKIAVALIAVSMTFGAASAAQATTSSITKLKVTATGAAESANSGAVTGNATGIFLLNEVRNTVCSIIKSEGLVGVTAAHIHKGAKGVDGAVVATINISRFNNGASCVKVSHAVLSEIAMNPAGYYFNVHTKAIPSGAVRGQLAIK